MKLLTKLNTRYILYALSVMIFSGIMIYIVISKVVNKQLGEKLTGISIRIEEKLADGGKVDYLQPFVVVTEIKNSPESKSISDTLIMNRNENEMEEYRQLSVVKKINETCYKIVVRESKIESEDLVQTLAGITLLAILFLTASLVLINRKVAKSIWAPFNKNLKKIESFSLQEHSPIELQQTGITEFDNLNDVLTGLTKQINSDYQNLRQFSEDASHEIQTPLAIVSAKLENLLNDEDLNENQLKAIQSAHLSVQRLSKLNKELLLLTKIENNQFPTVEKISLKKIIQDKLEEFQELLDLKNISVDLQFTDDFVIESNAVLCEIFMNNLLSNSINHNSTGGKIQLIQNENKFEIWNSGIAEITNPEKLFLRFYKENQSSKSVGLGLAIVAKICEVQGWKVSYTYLKPLHGFQVSFKI